MTSPAFFQAFLKCNTPYIKIITILSSAETKQIKNSKSCWLKFMKHFTTDKGLWTIEVLNNQWNSWGAFEKASHWDSEFQKSLVDLVGWLLHSFWKSHCISIGILWNWNALNGEFPGILKLSKFISEVDYFLLLLGRIKQGLYYI